MPTALAATRPLGGASHRTPSQPPLSLYADLSSSSKLGSVCLQPARTSSSALRSTAARPYGRMLQVVYAAAKKKKQQQSKKRRKTPAAADPTLCPCGSKKKYDSCCGALHAGTATDYTAADVMRARFSAYRKGLPEYIVSSTHLDSPIEAEFKQEDGTYGAGFLDQAAEFCEKYNFKKLSILQSPTPADDSEEATVLFKVWYNLVSIPGEQHTMTENSLFRKVDGEWLYYDRLN